MFEREGTVNPIKAAWKAQHQYSKDIVIGALAFGLMLFFGMIII